jgi:histidinol phosphatase-like PHP family hydrolase
MDYADDLLAQFDFVIASVHSRFNLSEEDQTRRICRALANRYVTMLGHPHGPFAVITIGLPDRYEPSARRGSAAWKDD